MNIYDHVSATDDRQCCQPEQQSKMFQQVPFSPGTLHVLILTVTVFTDRKRHRFAPSTSPHSPHCVGYLTYLAHVLPSPRPSVKQCLTSIILGWTFFRGQFSGAYFGASPLLDLTNEPKDPYTSRVLDLAEATVSGMRTTSGLNKGPSRSRSDVTPSSNGTNTMWLWNSDN